MVVICLHYFSVATFILVFTIYNITIGTTFLVKPKENKITCMVEAKNRLFQNRAKANGISPNLYHSGCSPKLSHTPLQFGRKCQSVSISRKLDAMLKRQAYSWDKDYDKEHGGDVISFLTHVCAI